jgi:hypothetical protein
MMAEQQWQPDAAAEFRELVSQWEKGINKFAGSAMNSDEFSRAMNKATTTSTTMQQQLGGLIGRYLATLNLPSRAEMMNIGERLQAIETSLRWMSRKLEKFWWRYCEFAASGPSRTKRPPSGEHKDAPS